MVFSAQPEECGNGNRQKNENEDKGIEEHIRTGAGMSQGFCSLAL